MKKSLLSIATLLVLSFTNSFSQNSSLSLNDSLIGFDEKSLIDAAPYRGITAEEMPFYLSVHKREFIKQKYNLRTIEAPKEDFNLNSKTAVAACVNEDFEEAGLMNPVPSTLNITTTNGINGWTANSGSNSGATGSCLLTSCCTSTPNALQVIAPGPAGLIDPFIGPAYPIHSVFGNSLNVNGTAVNGFNCYGDWFTKINNSTPGAGLTRITKTMTVTPSNVFFNFAYIAVVQGAHCCCDNGGVSIIFKDCLGNMLASASQYSISPPAVTACTPTGNCASPSTITVITSTINAQWYYNKWVNSSIDLSTWMGQCIRIEVTGIDCPYSGHGGYAYFDAQCAPTLVNEINSLSNKLSYKVYPNPTSGNFSIDLDKEIINGELELRNILGQVVFRQSVKKGSNQIKTENLSKGIYNYSVLQNKEVVSIGKIVIE